jgi:ElaB/YqjD/DUF883 family membrane-anchored ribosome-binding protein
MDHESEVIKQQMEETRSSLADKLEALEEHVASTVHSTTDAVTGTVENVKEAVEETVDTVSESVAQVKEAFDITRQVQEHPWLIMGGAVVVGYLGARLLERGVSEVSREVAQPTSAPPQRTESTGNGWNQPSAGPSQPGMLDRLTETLAPALDKVKGLALGVTAGVVGRMILESIPAELRGEVEGVINEVTRSLGATPMTSFLHPKENQNPAQARASAPPPRP